MTRLRLLLRNLLYHWRGNLAVFLGVAVGTAVLTGALLVGDSLRGSLRKRALQQLGWVEQVMIANRFVRQDAMHGERSEDVCPTILLQGSARFRAGPLDADESRPAVQRVTILGVDERFWQRSVPRNEIPASDTIWWLMAHSNPEVGALWPTQDLYKGEVVLSAALARDLNVEKDGWVTLYLPKATTIPRESLLGQRDAAKVVTALPLRVLDVLPEQSFGSQFSLTPTLTAPRNAFLPLGWLQARLQEETKADKTPLQLRGRVNAFLARGSTADLQNQLRQNLRLDDWGLLLRTPESRTRNLFARFDANQDGKLTGSEWSFRVGGEYRYRIARVVAEAMDANKDRELDRDEVLTYYRKVHPYLSLESQQLLIEQPLATAAEAAAQKLDMPAAPTLIYLADELAFGKETMAYVLVAALDPALPAPLGPFLPRGLTTLADDEIVLAEPPRPQLQAKPGDTLRLSYYDPEEGDRKRSQPFRLAGWLPIEGVAADPDLTPEVPGITDQVDMDQWDPPPQLHYDNRRVKRPDDTRYWQDYRTTPKAYVTLQAGQRLWGSRFGQATSIRLAPPRGHDGQPLGLEYTAELYEQALLDQLDPKQAGLVFDPVRQRRLDSIAGGMDFGILFVGFSFFLIAAALLLVGLLFRLNLDRRAAEIGLLLAVGYRRGQVAWLLLGEGLLLAATGGLVGSLGAIRYAQLLLDLLAAWWPGGLERSFLTLHGSPSSLLIGYLSSLAVSGLTIAWAVRGLSRVTPRALLAGVTTPEGEAGRDSRPPRWSRAIAVVSLVVSLVLIASGKFVTDPEMQAMTFFGGGSLLLTAALAGIWAWMHGRWQLRVAGHGGEAVARLGTRNAGRHPTRSLLTAGLLASATFVIVAVQAFHREPETDLGKIPSGSGGYPLWAEADVPIFQDLNSPDGRAELNFTDRDEDALKDVAIASFRLRTGDDASCLNMAQPLRPRLLGVPNPDLLAGRFRFAGSEAQTAEERANPWLLLRRPTADGPVPVIADATTAQWMLHAGLGSTIQVPNEKGEQVPARIVGLLQGSIFQSELLMAEAQFLKLYPSHQGYQFFLVAAPAAETKQVKELLAERLARRGLEVRVTADRLRSYLQVENTYLLTFQALGGLGLLLGALGLAVVLTRSVWERRGELALLRALGFRHGVLGWLVLTENGFLLVLGLLAGTVSALLAVAPHLASQGGTIPWLPMLALLGLVLLVGLTAGGIAVATTLRAPLLTALRRE